MSTGVTLLCGIIKYDGIGLNLSINPFTLRFIGLWYGPDSQKTFRTRVLYNLLTLWMLAMLFGVMVICASAIYMFRGDMDTIVSSGSLLIEDTGAFIKALAFVARRGALERAIENLDELSRDPVVARGGASSRRLLAQAARKGAIISFFFVSLCFWTYVTWCITPLMTSSNLECWAALRAAQEAAELRAAATPSPGAALADALALNGTDGPHECLLPAFPGVAYYVWDFYKNPGYTYAYLFQVGSIFYLSIVTSVIDTLYISMMIYVAALLQILAEDISTLRERCSNDQRNQKGVGPLIIDDLVDPHEGQMEKEITNVVDFHQKIIDAVYEVQSVISAPVLVQFIVCMTVMCMALYATAANSGGDNAATTKYGVYLYTIMIQLFLYCWYGDRVTQRHEEVALSAYGCGWASGSQPFKKGVLLVLLRAQKTLAFRGGVFYDLSRNTFLYIVNASYSFFNLLRTAQD